MIDITGLTGIATAAAATDIVYTVAALAGCGW